MNLVERLNARFNNVIHDGLALVGAVVDPWLAKLERQAMSNALGRDIGLDYADGLAAAEAEEEVHEPGFVSVRVNAGGGGGGMSPLQVLEDVYWCFEHKMTRGLCRDMHQAAWKLHSSAERRVSADPSPVSVGDTGPGAGMVPPPPAPGPSKCTCPTVECELLAEDICDESEEAELLDEFMELGEYLDTATAEELAAMRQQREVSEGDLTMRIAEARYTWPHSKAAESSSHYIAKYLLENYRITPK
ncbi:hypothetical protein SEA_DEMSCULPINBOYZ_63 [Mycobacterium phage Demsculpinboyz]|uniref:Uncharacterized protein n=1 Tax=Mycobacterium phage Demsculpinboyz TaxID=2041528 RepID=A0A2D1G9V6_9CAUD|nr:hypothetical protein I5I02_gp063 [Mycobacterium phage Demsculpinboyz]ATN88658.1 hypothetical protein SEA_DEMSCULPINBOYZ_63 [Mycobacterium phage Demsculpinboyz]